MHPALHATWGCNPYPLHSLSRRLDRAAFDPKGHRLEALKGKESSSWLLTEVYLDPNTQIEQPLLSPHLMLLRIPSRPPKFMTYYPVPTILTEAVQTSQARYTTHIVHTCVHRGTCARLGTHTHTDVFTHTQY